MDLRIIKIQQIFFKQSRNHHYLVLCKNSNGEEYVIYLEEYLDYHHIIQTKNEFFSHYNVCLKNFFHTEDAVNTLYQCKNGAQILFDFNKLFRVYYSNGYQTLLLNTEQFEFLQNNDYIL